MLYIISLIMLKFAPSKYLIIFFVAPPLTAGKPPGVGALSASPQAVPFR